MNEPVKDTTYGAAWAATWAQALSVAYEVQTVAFQHISTERELWVRGMGAQWR